MIFEVTSEHIERLNDTDLRRLVAKLCERELETRGYSASAVTSGGHQDAKDGGIDVRVSLPDATAIDGYVLAAETGYQVKAQDMPPSEIEEEMAPKGILRPSIRELANRGGAYIIVSAKGSVADSVLKSRREVMSRTIGKASPTCPKLILEFFDRQRIASWANTHSAVIPWVRECAGLPLQGWKSFADWSSAPGPIDQEYFVDDAVRIHGGTIRDTDGLGGEQGLTAIRAALAQPAAAIRLVGLSGVGKTRFVQALFDPRIGQSALPPNEAIYTDLSDAPEPVPLELVSHIGALNKPAVLIVDNCGIELHRKLVARIAGTPIRLITVEYDISDDEPENTSVYKLEPSSIVLIEKILKQKYPHLSDSDRHTVANFSTGNARIALALANTSRSGSSLANLRDGELFRRLFDQGKGSDAALLNAAKALSLLYSFEGEATDSGSEMEILAKLVGQTSAEIYRHSVELIRRQLIQKRGPWRAVLPHAIAQRLAKLALEEIPPADLRDRLVTVSSARMLKSISRRLSLMHDSPQAVALAREWLSDGGFLADIGKLPEPFITMLVNVAPIVPSEVLEAIRRASIKDAQFFSEANINRREIVRLLRSLAYEETHFVRCLALLAKFARDEKPSNQSDSARQVVASLFQIFLSGTLAAPEVRADSIRGFLKSTLSSEVRIGLDALESMLRTTSFNSPYGFEFGARMRGYGLHPRGRDQIQAWYKAVLALAAEHATSTREGAEEAQGLVAGSLKDLCLSVGIIDETSALARKIANGAGWPEGWIAVQTAIQRAPDNLPTDDLAKLSQLADDLKPINLREKIGSYVLSRQWGALDVADTMEAKGGDVGTEVARIQRTQERIASICKALGTELASEPALLDELLPRILRAQQSRVGQLGIGLALGSADPIQLWSKLVDEMQRVPKTELDWMVLNGFVSSLSSTNVPACERILDGALRDERLHPLFIYLQCAAGMTVTGVDRLLKATEVSTVPTYAFGQLRMGGISRGIPVEHFGTLLSRIANRSDHGVETAVQIYGMRMHGRDDNTDPILEQELSIGRKLLSVVRFEKHDTMFSYALGGIAKRCLVGAQHEAVAESLCGRLRDAALAHKASLDNYHDLLAALLKVQPNSVLNAFAGGPMTDDAPNLIPYEDMDHHRHPFDNLADADMKSWAESDPTNRYPRLAELIVYEAAGEATAVWSTGAKLLIENAPDPIKVLETFRERFHPGGWSGSLTDILAKRAGLLVQLEASSNPAIVEWASAARSTLANEVEAARKWEEDMDRNRDERFET